MRRILDLPYDSHRILLPLLLNTPSLEGQLVNRFVKRCKTMYIVEYVNMSFIFRFCTESTNCLMGIKKKKIVCQWLGLRVNGNLNGSIFMHYTNETRETSTLVDYTVYGWILKREDLFILSESRVITTCN